MKSRLNLHPFRGDRLTPVHVAAAALMAGLGVLATLPAWQEIYITARKDEESSHIFIVPIVALYLIFVRRIRLRFCPPTGRFIGPVIVALGWGIGSLGYYRGIQTFWMGGAVLVALGCALSVLGKNAVFRFFPAILVLVFLVPVPARVRLAVAGPLQEWTAAIANRLLEVFWVGNTDVGGNRITINMQPVLIAEMCNGLRMVFSLFLVCFAFSFALPLRNFVRVLILLASPLATILCNLVRILPTVWLYGYGPHVPGDFADRFHDYSGWLMLPIAFLLLYSIIKLLQWAMIPVTDFPLASQ